MGAYLDRSLDVLICLRCVVFPAFMFVIVCPLYIHRDVIEETAKAMIPAMIVYPFDQFQVHTHMYTIQYYNSPLWGMWVWLGWSQ